MKHLNELPRPLREINPGISPQLEYVVLRALERDPARRYQRPSDFLQALKQAEMPGSLPAAPADWSTKTTKNTYGSAQGVYNTVDEANMSTLSSDPQVLPQAMPRPISQPGVPFQSAQESVPATVTPPGRYPQLTPQPISHPGLVQGAPAQPPAKRAGRLPLAILAVLLVLLAGLALTLVTTPLGHNLFAGQSDHERERRRRNSQYQRPGNAAGADLLSNQRDSARVCLRSPGAGKRPKRCLYRQ